jgi:hypothetical protein
MRREACAPSTPPPPSSAQRPPRCRHRAWFSRTPFCLLTEREIGECSPCPHTPGADTSRHGERTGSRRASHVTASPHASCPPSHLRASECARRRAPKFVMIELDSNVNPSYGCSLERPLTNFVFEVMQHQSETRSTSRIHPRSQVLAGHLASRRSTRRRAEQSGWASEKSQPRQPRPATAGAGDAAQSFGCCSTTPRARCQAVPRRRH